MLSGSLKDSLFGLKSKLEDLEKIIDETSETKETSGGVKKTEKKRAYNTEEKLNELLGQDKQIVKLNIGGKIYQTKSSTLMAYPDSLFARALQEEELSRRKELFFDRSFNNFDLILDFLRDKKLNNKKMNKYDREDLIEEINFYGLDKYIEISKKVEYDIKWDQGLSKSGQCTVDSEDPKIMKVHSTGCYTHFVTDKLWRDENFVIELESNVSQTDSYLYYGIVNESYSYTGNCMCCSPSNAYYVQCNGSIKTNATTITDNNFAFQSNKTTIGMKVNLQEKNIQFYIPDKAESQVFPLIGNTFRVVSGHCNTGNGTITILSCSEP